MIPKHLYTEFVECMIDDKPVWVEIRGDWMNGIAETITRGKLPFQVDVNCSMFRVKDFKLEKPKEELVPYSICRVRDNKSSKWRLTIFKYINTDDEYPYVDTYGSGWKQCEQIKNPIVKLTPEQIEAIGAE